MGQKQGTDWIGALPVSDEIKSLLRLTDAGENPYVHPDEFEPTATWFWNRGGEKKKNRENYFNWEEDQENRRSSIVDSLIGQINSNQQTQSNTNALIGAKKEILPLETNANIRQINAQGAIERALAEITGRTDIEKTKLTNEYGLTATREQIASAEKLAELGFEHELTLADINNAQDRLLQNEALAASLKETGLLNQNRLDVQSLVNQGSVDVQGLVNQGLVDVANIEADTRLSEANILSETEKDKAHSDLLAAIYQGGLAM